MEFAEKIVEEINRLMRLNPDIIFKVTKQFYLPPNPTFFYEFFLIRAYAKRWWKFKLKIFAIRILENGDVSLRVKNKQYTYIAKELAKSIGEIMDISYGGWSENFDLDVHSTIKI